MCSRPHLVSSSLSTTGWNDGELLFGSAVAKGSCIMLKLQSHGQTTAIRRSRNRRVDWNAAMSRFGICGSINDKASSLQHVVVSARVKAIDDSLSAMRCLQAVIYGGTFYGIV